MKAKHTTNDSLFTSVDLLPLRALSPDAISEARLDSLEKTTESLKSAVDRFGIAAAIVIAVASLFWTALNSLISSKAETAIKESVPRYMADQANTAAQLQVQKAFNSYLATEKEGTIEPHPVKQGIKFEIFRSSGSISPWTSQPASEPRGILRLGIHRSVSDPGDAKLVHSIPSGPDGTSDPSWLFGNEWGQSSYGEKEYLWTSRVRVPVTASHLQLSGWIPSRGVHAELKLLALPARLFKELEPEIRNWKYGRPTRTEKDSVARWRSSYDPRGFIAWLRMGDGTSMFANFVETDAISVRDDDIYVHDGLLEIARKPLFLVSDSSIPDDEEIVLVAWGIVVVDWQRLAGAHVEELADGSEPDFKTFFARPGNPRFRVVEVTLSGWKSLGRGRLEMPRPSNQ